LALHCGRLEVPSHCSWLLSPAGRSGFHAPGRLGGTRSPLRWEPALAPAAMTSAALVSSTLGYNVRLRVRVFVLILQLLLQPDGQTLAPLKLAVHQSCMVRGGTGRVGSRRRHGRFAIAGRNELTNSDARDGEYREGGLQLLSRRRKRRGGWCGDRRGAGWDT